ncbi:beta-xylosidase [Actinosynnema sp. ALI-1.44]|uniref:beta-xylosidase n=1 Tax=Actinosynnema sp. ALI-1.44 TaxID=1933779 RepID=UPI001EDBC814|nr:beta-xylosidase [Actinosynnema sp. ALI-1.44]
MRRLVLLLLSAALLSSCTDTSPQADGAGAPVIGGGSEEPAPAPAGAPPPQPRTLTPENQRLDGGVVAASGENAQYNYAPSVMVEGNRTRMWWCSQLVSNPPPGDDVVYAEAGTPAGPFTTARAVFGGAGQGFDGRHTCDPSVIKVNGTYYLYYTGAPNDHNSGNAIGLATSADGLSWARANGGQPIVGSSYEVARGNTYGAGQPSALYLDGWFYLMFTDTNAKGAHDNGAGQFVLRAKDPAFATGVEALGVHGFEPGTGRDRSVADAFSADWMWIDALDAFAIAHETGGGTTITFWNREFTAHPYQPVLIAGPWEEGPGLARRPDGHAPISAADPCGRIPVDVVRATRDKAEPTDLRRFGLDLRTVDGCATKQSAFVTLEGFAMPSPQRTLDMVLGGQVFRVDRRSVAEAMGAIVIGQRTTTLDGVPVTAHVKAGAEVLRAEGRGAGLLLDGNRVYPVTPGVIGANSSKITDITSSAWDGYSVGPALAFAR